MLLFFLYSFNIMLITSCLPIYYLYTFTLKLNYFVDICNAVIIRSLTLATVININVSEASEITTITFILL